MDFGMCLMDIILAVIQMGRRDYVSAVLLIILAGILLYFAIKAVFAARDCQAMARDFEELIARRSSDA